MRILLILLLLISCSATTDGFKVREKGLEKTPSEVVSYFLSDSPGWINFNTSGSCYRKNNQQFFHLLNLERSLQLNYEETLSIQYLFNFEREKFKKRNQNISFSRKDEESLFFRTLNDVKAGVRIFVRPITKRINLIWIDPLLKNKKKLIKLKKVFSSREFNKSYPIFVSFCFTYLEVRDFIEENNFPQSVRVLGSELLTVFSPSFKMKTRYYFPLKHYFLKKQKLFLYLPKEKPEEFYENIPVINY